MIAYRTWSNEWKEAEEMVITLSFRPDSALSTQSVWFIFMYSVYTLKQNKFSPNSIVLQRMIPNRRNIYIYTHTHWIWMSFLIIRFGIWGEGEGISTSFNSISYNTFHQQLRFFLFWFRFVSTASFKFIPLKMNYIHTQPLRFVTLYLLYRFRKFSKQILSILEWRKLYRCKKKSLLST